MMVVKGIRDRGRTRLKYFVLAPIIYFVGYA